MFLCVLYTASYSFNNSCIPFLIIAVLALKCWHTRKTKARISAECEKEISEFQWISVFDSEEIKTNSNDNNNNNNETRVFSLKDGRTELLHFFTVHVEPLNQRYREEKYRSDCWFLAMLAPIYIVAHFSVFRAHYLDSSRNLNTSVCSRYFFLERSGFR
ncbi:hypothetical protein GCK72_016941 [Caenorhabditis remanei]|uniref:Uncharacterized protein n=1 Tax=Caenorhabditis remanei TaxID=31234 RepID=A0A6A5G6S2_CAERE|nr:hypothetical protein GCK72_016941 [Caenorhabditis remanei]KAF1750392.1 hypothetical protein GCK72_016941 [Caenorhabditis remanei]